MLSLLLVGCLDNSGSRDLDQELLEDEYYYSHEDVALYLDSYEKLPENYIKKDEARELGWLAKEGNLWEVAPGMVIGGDYFGNREKLLPSEGPRDYYECDVNYDGGHRNAERLVFSNDGLIYYTKDHYKSFELLYGDE